MDTAEDGTDQVPTLLELQSGMVDDLVKGSGTTVCVGIAVRGHRGCSGSVMQTWGSGNAFLEN